MKLKTIIIAVAVALFTIAIGTLLADPGNGKAKGWPNHGISSPGHPNHEPHGYASPRKPEHP